VSLGGAVSGPVQLVDGLGLEERRDGRQRHVRRVWNWSVEETVGGAEVG